MSEVNIQTIRRVAPQSPRDLVYFASPIFDLILRLQAGLVKPSNELRPKIKSLLEDFDRRTERYKFNHRIVNEAKFALAAFVDETVLTGDFHLKEEWERFPIQLEYFQEQLAGEKFFDRLENLLLDIQKTADAVEVYYVCLLLGFKGKYAIYEQNKLLDIMQKTANALVKVGKIKQVNLSPNAIINDQPPPPEKKGLPMWAKLMALGGLLFVVLIYLVMYLLASKFLDDTMQRLQL
ncbi:MAG: type IVB secretion system protein IcmH/DotU [Pyrinomonadaceae bacterium]|nr:type IVB secretion system protein IcmH/DotU [Pyrinomonadaceae bacterium]MCX7639078.1 type IVB secretion system protein IcmH/DotU [Pyrinomonadaceae bacterium]MDW8303701.1 type IVB secretion system protein IcmH/DotU [Acidobacteriota bacterium]